MSTGTLWASCGSSASSLSSPKPKPPQRSLRTRRTFQSFSRERAPPVPVFSSESAPGSCGAVNSYDKSSLTKEKEVAMQKEIGKTAGAIWDALNTRGEQSLQPVEENTGRKKNLTVSFDETKHDTTSSEEDHSSIASARSNNWAECRDQKSVGTEPTEKMSLDIRFYRTGGTLRVWLPKRKP